MKKSELFDRRNFNKLAIAAMGGIAAGAVAGCGPTEPVDNGGDDDDADHQGSGARTGDDDDAVAKGDVHVCRGLNACEGKGAGGDNACAGQGTCATAEKHECHTKNACKGQGGCGDHPGENDCKGKGKCSVPLHEGAWETAREHFEERMKADGKDFGPAPPKVDA